MGAGRPRATTQHLEVSGLLDRKKKCYAETRRETQLAVIKDVRIDPPKKYSQETKQAWMAIVPNLVDIGVLTEVDLPSMQMMFDCYEEYVQAKKAITKFEKIHSILEPDYVTKRKALNTWMVNSQINFNKIAARFGIMPTERSRLPINEGEGVSGEEDPLEIILS